MSTRQEQLIDLAREGNSEALTDLFKEYPAAYKRVTQKEGLKNGGLARRKRSIARGCGAIMENKRKKTLYTQETSMTDFKMVEIGTDKDGNSLYNVRDNSKGGELVVEKALSLSEAESLMNSGSTSSYKSMSKLELEAIMREHGIELDRRKSKKELLEEVENFFKE